MRVLIILAILMHGSIPVVAQDVNVGPGAEVQLPDMCLASYLTYSFTKGPSCPSPGSTTKTWTIECNPLCYPTTHPVSLTTSGYCYDFTEKIPYLPPVWKQLPL